VSDADVGGVPSPRGTRAGVPWLPPAVYVAAAVTLTFPLAFSLTSRLGALQGPGDPYLNLWILGWGLRAWTTDPMSVISGRVFDANIFFPAEGTLAYSEHFLLQALALAPIYLMTENAVLCYNLLLLGSIVISGLMMHAFARTVTGSEPGAYVAGLAWACWPYRTAHILHIQLQALYFLPLVLLCLHRVMARRRWRDTLGLAAAATLQIIASVYYGLMAAVVLVVSAVTLAIASGQWRSSRLWSRLACAAALTIAVSTPVLLPYVRTQQTEGFGRTLFEAAAHSASWQAYAQVPPVNLVYGQTGLLQPRAAAPGQRDRTHVEHQLFPGFALLTLSILGVARTLRTDARAPVLSSIALVGVGVLLSFGPEGWRAFYAALHDNVYGFQAIRAPARFAVLAMLGMVTLAALGMRSLTARPAARSLRSPGRRAPAVAAALALGGLSLEYVNAPLPLAAAPPLRTDVGQWLAREPTPGAVVHLPLTGDVENTPYMVQSLEHGRPIVNGYSGQRPAFFSSLVDNLADLPSPTAFAALRDVEVRFVVSPAPIAGAGNERSPLVERARLAGGTVYEVRWTPAALAGLDESTGPPPPPPGRARFAAGEAATYDVYWEGGPMNVPAGTATLSVAEGSDGADRWRFEIRAETANWVARFFQARDRFVTIADPDLLPLEHHREIREGRRQVDRRYRYDRATRTIQTGEMTLPLGADAARDALTAFYYVRTLPLEPGSIISLPMNEAGTPLVLQVSVADVEDVEHGGSRVRALRLEPRVMRRIERRRAVAITLWLTDDERRVPLRALVDAGFGRIRLELIDYTAGKPAAGRLPAHRPKQ
jgi:hypothetical protein